MVFEIVSLKRIFNFFFVSIGIFIDELCIQTSDNNNAHTSRFQGPAITILTLKQHWVVKIRAKILAYHGVYHARFAALKQGITSANIYGASYEITRGMPL